ncbi:MAG TPA: hypothetical protein VN764_05500, partial [Polyangiaceae bacterium]|nr:hypothetical protein [Polyangiaceae bacterium]
MTGATNGSHRVRLRTTCLPTDLFCVDDLMWTAWPSDPNAGYLTNGEFEYEAFGARIGHQWATLELVKENEQYVQSVADSFDVRLDPETIVVP